MPSVKPPSKIQDGRFETVKRLGAGCFGEVFKGLDTQSKLDVAIKFENREAKSAPQLEHETEVLNELRANVSPPPQGIAEVLYFGIEKTFNCMVMEMLGKSLEDHVQACKGKMTVKTTVLIAEQVIQRTEFMHSKGFIHRDIKPENFMFGINAKVHHVYIIDFGLSKMYWDKFKQAHNPMKQKLSLTGTARYASINAHKGFEQSRRDDLEAIGHMFLYFLRGALPWSGLDAKTQEEKYRKICEKKEQTPISDLNTGFPKQFDQYLDYCRKLQFTDRPDYNNLYGLIHACREAGWKDHHYQWFDDGKEPAGELVPLVTRQTPNQPDDRRQNQSGGKGLFCCLCGSKGATRD
jgi:serine/threonine protein kinase